MKRVISWLADNADAVIGLGLAVFASVVGLLGAVPGYLLANVTVLTLATLAFVMLRDRHRQETAARKMRQSVNHASAELLEHMSSFRAASTVRVLIRPEITQALEASRRDTKQLIFKGATGDVNGLIKMALHERNPYQ